MTTTTTTPDFTTIKERQQSTWSSGDYAAVATRIQVVADLLADHADVQPGSRVLDVAAGSGNATIAAARLGADVTGLDYVPALLDRARERAQAERLPVDLVIGDAEELPFPDESFDMTLSVFGVMFAPDHERAAAELVRVTRPNGTIALANWTPSGFIGGLLRTVARHVPPPAGLLSPVAWGTEEHIRHLLEHEVSSLNVRERRFNWRFASPAEFIHFFRTNYGPTLKAFAALSEDDQAELGRDLAELAREHARSDDGGALTIPAAYLEVIATRA